MASKRLKLWAVVNPDGSPIVYESKADAIDEKEAHRGGSYRLVRMVEHDLAMERVVKAAKKLVDAVKAMEKRR